jgi:hypothetical protein
METYNFETVIGKSGIIVLPDIMKTLVKHRVRFTADDLEKSASDAGNGLSDKLLGLFSDEPELIDEITESAMKSRENDPLRCKNG